MKPIFGLKIMSAEKWQRNIDRVRLLQTERNMLTEKVGDLDCEWEKLRVELDKYKRNTERMQEIMSDRQQHIHRLSRRCAHLERELEKAEKGE